MGEFADDLLKFLNDKLGEAFSEAGSRVWDYAFSSRLSVSVDYLDLMNSWLFLLTKLFKISSRVSGEARVRLAMVGAELYVKGLDVFYGGVSYEEAKAIMYKEFKKVIGEIENSGYEYQKADDYLIHEVLEELGGDGE